MNMKQLSDSVMHAPMNSYHKSASESVEARGAKVNQNCKQLARIVEEKSRQLSRLIRRK